MRRFVIYIDILGYSRLLKKRAKDLYLTPPEVRKQWKQRVEGLLKKAKKEGVINDFKEMTADSWVIFCKAPDDVYELLALLLKVKLPLEIAVGFDNFPKADDFTLTDNMMDFLKEDILTPFKEWYKEKHGKSIHETFIVVTEKAYETLGSDSYWEKPYGQANYYFREIKSSCERSPISPLVSKDFFHVKCCEYLKNQIDVCNSILDEKMGSREYYVEPVILDEQKKPILIDPDRSKGKNLGFSRGHFVVSSKSGQGKTVFLLKYFVAKAEKFIEEKNKILPFFFHLENLRNFEKNIVEFLIDKIFGCGTQINGINRSNLINLMDTKLSKGEVLFLFDGLDQTKVGKNIKSLFGLGPGGGGFLDSIVVVAGRPYAVRDWKDTMLCGYKELEIAPFNLKQITQYFMYRQGIDHNKFKKLIQDFFEMVQIPIIMYLLGEIAQEDFSEDLSKKTDVYEMFCSKIIADGLKKLRHIYSENYPAPSSEKMMGQLQHIAYLGLNGGQILTLDQKFVNNSIINKVDGISTRRDVETLCQFGIIYNILDEGALQKTHYFLEFKHQSFQAYFAARQLVKEVNKGNINLQKLLKKKTDEAWLEVFSLFAELPDTTDKDKLLLSEALLDNYLKNQDQKDMLYEAAKVFSCLQNKDSELGDKTKDILLDIVEVSIEHVLENEKPFLALKNLGQSKYLAEYAANQEKYNSVNRFYAFKYLFASLGEDLDIYKKYLSQLCTLESNAKLDFIFALNRIDSKPAKILIVDFFQEVFSKVYPESSTLISILGSFFRFLYGNDKFLDFLRHKSIQASFFTHKNTFNSFRNKVKKKLGSVTSRVLFAFESSLFKHIYKTDADKWINYEDICMVALGVFGNEELVSRFYEDFLSRDILTPDDLYKQSVAACALAFCFPGETSQNQEMVEKITTRCIEMFEAGAKNPYRYYIAGALARIGNQTVMEYFLDFIKRPEEKQRWFAAMVLGCMDNSNMLIELEGLSNLPDTSYENKRTKYFANQALLVYNQTYIWRLDEDEDAGDEFMDYFTSEINILADDWHNYVLSEE